MASRGQGRRGRPRGAGQAPPTYDQPLVFDQQAFVEAVGVAAAAIARASVADSQGGPSNLQRFRAHHPPTFTGGGDPMVADHWFMQLENVLEAMEITSDTTRVRLAAFQLESEARVWWRWVRTSRDYDMGRVPGVVHWQVFSRDRKTCQSSRVPRAETESDDSDGLRGSVHGVSQICG